MSENIRGITFAEQTVTPADDAIVRRAILSDGILSGCNITYSGSTLTMAAGYVIACGRIFQITAVQNWAVVDATSGVARLVLTIDLTKTATESAFDQISFGIDYATAENGFVNLTQDDINIAGVRYQVSVAVVSLGAGGITGIISKLEKAEGGGGLNFKVVAGLTQPGSATENTIWVMTEKIGGYYFSATQPDSIQELDVWICTGQSSSVAFNALRKNAIQIYPISAKQMVGGVLVDVTAKSYINGAWVDWYLEEWIILNGKTDYEFILSDLTMTQQENSIRFKGSDYGYHEAYIAADLTSHNTLVIKGTFSVGNGFVLAVWDKSVTPNYDNAAAYAALTNTGAALDVSSMTGEYYVGFTSVYNHPQDVTDFGLVR